jgi:hypothetical protein
MKKSDYSHTTRTDLASFAVAIRPSGDTRRIVDTMDVFLIEANDTSTKYVYLADSRRAYRLREDAARALLAGLTEAIGGDAE